MRDQQGFADFAAARAGDLRRQAYLLTGSPERAVRLTDKALADTGRRWDRLGGADAAEEHARRVVAAGSLRGRGTAPAFSLTARGTAAATDDTGEAVRRALAGLPPRRRAVLVLRYDEGLDNAAVGARLGVPPAKAEADGEAGLITLRSLLRRRGRPEDLLPAALAETPLPAQVDEDTSAHRESTDSAGAAGTAADAAAPEEPPGAAGAAAESSGAAGTAGESPGAAGAAGESSGAAGTAAEAAAAAGAAAGRRGAADTVRSTERDSGPAAGASQGGAASGSSAPSTGAAAGKPAGPASEQAAEGHRAPRWRRWLVAAVGIVVVGIAAAFVVPALRADSVPQGPVPAASGSGPSELPWPARGPLAGDEDLLRSALRAWQSGVPDRQRPVQSAALWAGDLDGDLTVLLQGTDGTGQSWLAEVIGSGDTASLRSTEPLGRAVPVVALGTSAGAVRLLADPDAAPNSILAGVGNTLKPLAVGHDGLTQGVTAPPTGLRVVLTDGGTVLRSGTVLPGRLSPVTGPVELTRPTLGLGPAQPPAQAWYDDGELISGRLGGPVELVQVGPVRAASAQVKGRPVKLEARAYEVVRGGTRYLATVVRPGGDPACVDTATVGPAEAAPAKPAVLVARCIAPGGADGVLAAVGTGGVRSVQVMLAPAAPAVPGRFGVPPRPARPARTVTVTGASGSGLVGLATVAGMQTSPAPAAARDAGNHQLAGVTLPAYKAPRP